MKIIYFFILCFFSNLCFGRSVELNISVVGLEKDVDDYNLKIDFDINKLKDLKDDQVTDEIVTYIQVNRNFLYDNSKAAINFYESLSDENSINRKLIIFLSSQIKEKNVNDYFNKNSLDPEYYICGLSLCDNKSKRCYDLNVCEKICVNVAFGLYRYEIKNYHFISDYERYFDINKLSKLNKITLNYFKNAIKSKDRYFYIDKENTYALYNIKFIGIGYFNSDYVVDRESKTIKFTIIPIRNKKGLIKPVIFRTMDNKEYKIDVNDCDYTIGNLCNIIHEKKLIDNFDFFYICNNDGSVFKNEDMLEPEVYLKLCRVYFNYNYSNDVKEEEYIDNKNLKVLNIEEIQGYIEGLESYFKRHKDIQLKFNVNNKSYDIDADNPLTNNHYINELVEEIINSSNPNVYIDVSKKKGKEIKNNKPIKTTTTTKIDKIDNSINIVPTKHKKYNTTTESSKTATHTLDSSHIMDKGGISNKPKIGGGNGCCRCPGRS